MKFPIVIIKASESPIYFFDSGSFGLVSKGGEAFYKNGMIYDSEGSTFLINGIESKKNATVLESIKYFQQMYRVNVKYTANEKGTLSAFKKKIINHIRLFEKYWVKKDLLVSLERSIMEKDNFHEIIMFLK
jgi:hypothetical protein